MAVMIIFFKNHMTKDYTPNQFVNRERVHTVTLDGGDDATMK